MYVGSPYVQRGHDMGSFLAGPFRAVKPLAIRGCRSLGQLPPPSERALLRCIYFFNPDHSTYFCLGFYPDRGHRAFFELGVAMQAPLISHPSLVPTLALHLLNLCEHPPRGEGYRCNEMSFRMQTVVGTTPKIALER